MSPVQRKCVEKQGLSCCYFWAYLVRVPSVRAFVEKVLFEIFDVATMAAWDKMHDGLVREGHTDLHVSATVRVAVRPAIPARISVPM